MYRRNKSVRWEVVTVLSRPPTSERWTNVHFERTEASGFPCSSKINSAYHCHVSVKVSIWRVNEQSETGNTAPRDFETEREREREAHTL